MAYHAEPIEFTGKNAIYGLIAYALIVVLMVCIFS